MQKEKKIEKGNIIDQLGSIILVAFVFALILAYSGYGKVTQERLAINNVAKEYLYKMEEQGYLSSDNEDLLVSDMKSIGATVNSTKLEDGTATSTSQVTYGDKVTLALQVSFSNPFYTLFGMKNSQFHIPGFEKELNYIVRMSSTAKW